MALKKDMKTINKYVTNNFINLDFLELIFMIKRIHKAISDIAIIGETGLYFKENEAKTKLPENQPNKLRPERKSTRNISVSFLLNI